MSKKKFYTEYDECLDALYRCNLRESVIPTKAGVIIENVEGYNKINRLLEVDEFEPAHQFLYSLDPDEMSPEETDKVNRLYKLGQNKGLILPDETGDLGDLDNDIAACLTSTSDKPECDTPAVTPPVTPVVTPAVEPDVKVSVQPQLKTAYTMCYSAVKDGKIRTGECYSNAISPASAKCDCLNKLYKAGFENITILALEVNDEEFRGSDVYNPPLDLDETEDEKPVEESDVDEEEVDKDEDSKDETEDDESEEEVEESEEETEDSDDEESDDDLKEEEAEDEESKEETDDSDDEESEEDKEDDEASDDEAKTSDELSGEDKQKYTEQYKKAWKQALAKAKITKKAFNDLSLDEKISFFKVLSQIWGDKPDSSKFLSSTDELKLNSMKGQG